VINEVMLLLLLPVSLAVILCSANISFGVLFFTEYPYLSADWQSSVKDRFYDEKTAEVIFLFNSLTL